MICKKCKLFPAKMQTEKPHILLMVIIFAALLKMHGLVEIGATCNQKDATPLVSNFWN